MHRLILYLLTLVVIAGCYPARYAWQHPEEPGEERLEQDRQVCRDIIQEEITYPYPGYGYRQHFYFDRPWPLYARDPFWHHHDHWPWGYGWYDDPYAYYYYRDDLFRVCMRAKGWRQVPIEKE